MSLSKFHILPNTSTLLLLLSFSLLSSYSFADTLPESNNVKNEFMDQTALFAAITTRKDDLSNESNVTAAISDKISRNIILPAATQGATVILSLRLDKKGNVLSIKTQGSNAIVNQAVKRAALSASPLPIDLNNPDSFRDLTVKINVQ